MNRSSIVAALSALVFCALALVSATNAETVGDKTLVVWAAPSVLEQSGGSALTLDMADPDSFDAVVFAELCQNTWMPGSSGYRRTNQTQDDWLKETEANGEFVRVCVVYRGNTIELYRNDELSASYEVGGQQPFDENATILIGPRHMQDQRDVFVGKIKDARVYPFALSFEQIKTLAPGSPLEGAEPWFWADFGSSGLFDRTGRFNKVLTEGDVSVSDGALVLGEDKGKVFFTSSSQDGERAETPSQWSKTGSVPGAVMQSSRLLREKLIDDPYRPRWHFTTPEDVGIPGDPNGCFYADGRYHLMYLYARTGSGFCWGHLTSVDLVHWRHCPDSIGPDERDSGCFSGGAFLDDDGTAYLTYWKLGDLGIGAAKSVAPYNEWTKFGEPIIPSTEFGITELAMPNGELVCGSADPSNIWKKDGKYYVLTGNLCLLNKYGREEDAPENMKGDRLYLFESNDVVNWDYKGVFYQRRDEWTDASEDDMCPSFLPLPSSPDGGAPSGKHLLLFISHNKGCQYYVGDYDQVNDRFLPNNHGRMTWVDNTYFAPEALIDGKGRQIMWAWLLDNPENEAPRGWSGVYGLPRTLWLGEDGTLRMKPVPELEALRMREQTFENAGVPANGTTRLSGFPGDSFELELQLSASELAKAKRFGVEVRVDENSGEKTTLFYDADAKELVFDSRSSGKIGRPALERAPLELGDGEDLALRVFVDKTVVEIYANDKQAICRRVYPSDPNAALGVSLWNGGSADATAKSVRVWELAESNPY
ncbi:MAG: GH32 C-terminal domain-containing protein [Thermoguttaceae bacterium]|nr:GH32 C-terminal domain-containing protein [Thermoguttaceae bacterium]